MALNSDIRDQAYQFFIEEAPELLHSIESGLLTLREERSTAKVHEIMRAAHSLKGGAASVELNAIKTLSHRLEDAFKALYNETVEIDTELESLLLKAYDCLKNPLMEQIQVGSFDADAALQVAEPIFKQLEERLGDSLANADRYIPSSSDLGIDIVSSIFEVDVAQGLERLANVVANPQNYEVAGELRAQAEVFVGFAELLGLPGFGEIAQVALQALDRHPDKTLQITQLALADWQVSREQVLAGDRDRGGNPSEVLIALAQGSAGTAALLVHPEIVETQAEFDAQSLEAFWGETAPPALDDIFGTVTPAPETAPINFSTPSLDEVFGSVAPETTEASPSLDEVFGSVAPETTEASPSLDEVFGSVAPETTEASPMLYFTESKPEELAEKIDAAVQSVEQIFDRLPSIEETSEPSAPLSFPLPTSATPAPIAAKTNRETFTEPDKHPELPGVSAAKAASNLSVRVDFNRLERMNNLVGELSINRNSLSLQNEQIQGGVKELLARFARFQKMTGKLRELSDQMLVKPMNDELGDLKSDRDSTVASSQSSEFRIQSLAEFDALEMDSYGALYSLLQGLVEEMIQLEEAVEDIVLFARNSNQSLEQQRQMLTNLRDELMWARMLPLGEVLNRFPRTLRDLSTTYHKPVKLKLSGTGVLVDKAALEKLYDPLLHLLRNAFDHGIEPPEVRKQQGKSEEGQIEIRAFHQGNQTIIEIKDDGRGLNLEKIGQKAISVGLATPEELAMMTEDRIAELIFEPGFSTASQVSELSGRGVGLDVVRSQLRSLKGTVVVTSTPGKGTTFTLRLPLTLTISKLLVCLMNQEVTGQATAVALPSDSIEEIIIPTGEQIKKSGSQRFLHWQQQIIPIYRLNELLTYNCALPEITSSKVLSSVPTPDDWALPLLLLRRGQQLFALEVNRLVSEQELVIKPFGSAIASPSYTYGCTILGDGTLIPVINGGILLDQFLEPETAKAAIKSAFSDKQQIANAKSAPTVAQATTILVVDDSATLRRTLALTLQKAGYRVVQARDGREAIEQLQQTAGIQLVICDVEMPNMNGFEFLGQRRRDPEMTKIPVAMLTSRSSDKHRQLAMHLGASAYFTKPFIEQQFLAAIKDLLAQNSSKALTALR
ncbi:chemotaxis protein histidine kinase-like protein [Pleurocapsa sp. PCC 7327]|uniref:hybrid sensor histidine kinase/response regulator n=1 Tax=Pleurocapsa sp. PCC 7327 TaxID=118163 RepID=UPI00029FE787|nr:hybrid sensor histidine kinase/response regulator [Pleurocapsa sp. PCC 7327]AFY77714.1 chemotaxis protein histidine kinase-like protein [Pleurocapsa sp. PCC 7327]